MRFVYNIEKSIWPMEEIDRDCNVKATWLIKAHIFSNAYRASQGPKRRSPHVKFRESSRSLSSSVTSKMESLIWPMVMCRVMEECGPADGC